MQGAGLPGHGGGHHARRQLLVVLGADDMAAIVAQRDVGRFGVERASVGGRHRHYAQVPNIPEGSVQVVDGGTVWVEVAAGVQVRVSLLASLQFISCCDSYCDESVATFPLH